MTLGERVNAVEFDHPFTIEADTVLDVPGVFAPSVYSWEQEDGTWSEAEPEDSAWQLVSHGWTGQDRYKGPVMHNSEFIGEGIAERLAEMAEDYRAFAVCAVDCIGLDGEQEHDGWVVLGLPRNERQEGEK
jgi:hypothetical protein